MNAPRSLTPDCASCAALCCLALALDKGPRFAIDKPAGLPCPNLSRHACAIHADLDASGFKGCISYDCLGAGQRVTQELFQGESWRDTPALASPMMDSFRQMRAVQDDLQLLHSAAALPLSAAERATRDTLEAALSARMTRETCAAAAAPSARAKTAKFLRGLAHHIAR